jgi:GMP synthase-like glutamine amidotransferase
MASDPRPGLVLQNGHDGPPALLGDWLSERGIEHVVHRAWEGPLPADPHAYAFVATLGSPHSVNATEPPWIPRELEFLRAATAQAVPVLGLCWGAQALAVVLGGRVAPAPRAEVGWIAVQSDDPLIANGPWLHYHYDLFTVPPGATELARSPAGPAAFTAGAHLGVQFHPEATPEMGVTWARGDRQLTVSTPDVVAAEGARFGDAARGLAFELFDAWTAHAGVLADVSERTASRARPRSPSA